MKENSGKKILGNGIETIADVDSIIPAPNYRGSVLLDNDLLDGKKELLDSCPTGAIRSEKTSLAVDHGRCIMCGYCNQAAPGLVIMKSKPASPVKDKMQLMGHLDCDQKPYEEIGGELREKIQKMFGRSLAIREVDAGSCNGCEIEIAALNNSIYDVERFGIHFVASPRHADVLLVTGPASKNMESALRRTYEATPGPKIVIAVGACACTGGIFGDTYATTGGIDKIVPVDVYIPGCPPRPEVLIKGLLLAVDRMTKNGN